MQISKLKNLRQAHYGMRLLCWPTCMDGQMDSMIWMLQAHRDTQTLETVVQTSASVDDDLTLTGSSALAIPTIWQFDSDLINIIATAADAMSGDIASQPRTPPYCIDSPASIAST